MIALPNINSLDARYYKSYWAAVDVPRHIWHYTIKGIISLVESKGFKLEKNILYFLMRFTFHIYLKLIKIPDLQ